MKLKALATLALFIAFLFSFNLTAFGQCATPTNLTSSNVQSSSADLSWDAVAGARRYRIRYRPVGTSSWKSLRTRNTNVTIQNLQSGTTYQWQVRTICRGQSSPYSALATFITISQCPVPTPFNPLGVGSHQATLIWENINAQVSGYNIRWRELGTNVWNVVLSISTNLYIVQGLIPLTTYEYQVQSVCGTMTSPFSPSVQWSTPANVCTAPTGFQVNAIGTDFVSLVWQPVGGTLHYRIRYREVGSLPWLIKDFIGGTSTTISNLFPNTTYEAQVQSECTLGATDWSTLISFTTQQISNCNEPQNLFASMVTASSANHNWDPVTGALSYTMRRRIVGTQSWTTFATTQTSITTYLLDPGTTYEFQVRTHCTIGNSDYSASALYTTLGDPPCPSAANLQVSNVTPTSADFDWDDVAGVLHYRFEWRIQGSTSWSWVQTTSSYIGRTGLQPATLYEWRVGSLCTSGGTYTFSDIETFTTAASGQCTTPSGLFVLGVGQTQATLLWGSVPEANTYDVRLRETGTIPWTNFTGVASNLKVVTGLTPATAYEWQVRANCSSQSSSYSSLDFFTTQAASDGQHHRFMVEKNDRIETYPEPYKIYPNPTTQSIFIEGKAIRKVEIYNSMGQLVLTQEHQDATHFPGLNLRELGLVKGIYSVGIWSTTGQPEYHQVILSSND